MLFQVSLSTSISKFLSYNNNNKKCKSNKSPAWLLSMKIHVSNTCLFGGLFQVLTWILLFVLIRFQCFFSFFFFFFYLFLLSVNGGKTDSPLRNFIGTEVQITLTLLFSACERKYLLLNNSYYFQFLL